MNGIITTVPVIRPILESSWPKCLTERPRIVIKGGHPAWTVRCEHFMFWMSATPWWEDPRDEYEAYRALIGLQQLLQSHEVEEQSV